MTRNVVAVIGSAGTISDELRRLAESLARALAMAGFDLVTGGMDGVMRAVARGYRQAATATNLIHVEPGWGRAWERNPHPASIVRTGLGAMRNHVVVRSADLVVALGGGAGTLSELALAWQEGKPTAALRTSGDWATRLADTALDHRRDDSVIGCDTVDEVVSWATRLRPQGVFKGRENRGFYPCEVPALHRVHRGEPSLAERVHLRYGMSVEYADLTCRLQKLNDTVERWNLTHDAETVALVTFDDGWKDVVELSTVFEKLPCLCPVLFVGENHFGDSVRPLPLQRLYQHCAEHGLDPADDLAFGSATRGELKKNARDGAARGLGPDRHPPDGRSAVAAHPGGYRRSQGFGMDRGKPRPAPREPDRTCRASTGTDLPRRPHREAVAHAVALLAGGRVVAWRLRRREARRFPPPIRPGTVPGRIATGWSGVAEGLVAGGVSGQPRESARYHHRSLLIRGHAS